MNNFPLQIHLSIDDVWYSFEALFCKKITSIFDVPLFNILYKYHLKFDLKTTLYVVASNEGKNILEYDTRFRKEFEKNSDWLKFALHCTKLTSNQNEAYEDYFKFLDKLEEIVGYSTMSTIVRLHGFNCPPEIIEKMDSKNIRLLLCADDVRNNYGLTTTENNIILKQHYLQKDNLTYIKTAFRLENHIFTKIKQKESKLPVLPVFTHEYFFYGRRKPLGLYMMRKLVNFTEKNKLSYYLD